MTTPASTETPEEPCAACGGTGRVWFTDVSWPSGYGEEYGDEMIDDGGPFKTREEAQKDADELENETIFTATPRKAPCPNGCEGRG